MCSSIFFEKLLIKTFYRFRKFCYGLIVLLFEAFPARFKTLGSKPNFIDRYQIIEVSSQGLFLFVVSFLYKPPNGVRFKAFVLSNRSSQKLDI